MKTNRMKERRVRLILFGRSCAVSLTIFTTRSEESTTKRKLSSVSIGNLLQPLPWLDLPLRAHILAGSHVWPTALFLIFSVVNGTDIVPLVPSIACQRAVWGLPLLVVGFEISNVDRTGRVHVGWVEQNEA